MEIVFERLKDSDWQAPLFLAIASGAILGQYDLNCVQSSDISLIKAFLVINIIGTIIILGSLLTYGRPRIFGIIATLLIVLYNIAVVILIILALIYVKFEFSDSSTLCPSGDIVQLYFKWMVTTSICNLLFMCFKKLKRREKYDKTEGLIIRGSHRPPLVQKEIDTSGF